MKKNKWEDHPVLEGLTPMDENSPIIKLMEYKKSMNLVTVVISTRKRDEEYYKHVKKMFSHPKTQILIYDNEGTMSLPEVYNKGLEEAENDLVDESNAVIPGGRSGSPQKPKFIYTAKILLKVFGCIHYW